MARRVFFIRGLFCEKNRAKWCDKFLRSSTLWETLYDLIVITHDDSRECTGFSRCIYPSLVKVDDTIFPICTWPIIDRSKWGIFMPHQRVLDIMSILSGECISSWIISYNVLSFLQCLCSIFGSDFCVSFSQFLNRSDFFHIFHLSFHFSWFFLGHISSRLQLLRWAGSIYFFLSSISTFFCQR